MAWRTRAARPRTAALRVPGRTRHRQDEPFGQRLGGWHHGGVELAQLKEGLGAAIVGAASPLAAADLLCEACVDLLGVDGASISLVDGGATQGTFGSSGALSRMCNELQFTFGQGPCLDAVCLRSPVMADDLDGPDEYRWPALTEAMLGHGIRAVYAIPVTVASAPVGALDLYRRSSGPLDAHALNGGLWAAGLAALLLLDLMTADVDWQSAADGEDGWEHLASLERVEVYQATGALVVALGVTVAEAVVRLRAHAITHGLTASEVAYRILDRRIVVKNGEFRNCDYGWGQS